MKYFLDCGSNIGQGFEYFRKIYWDEYLYKLFEPNKQCYNEIVRKYFNSKNVEIFNSAVYINNSNKSFNLPEIDFTVAGSIIENHNSGQEYNRQKYEVSCIDIVEYIDKIYNNMDEIIIKFDIESSEYDILEKW